jgi:translation elongation factor EF-Ts
MCVSKTFNIKYHTNEFQFEHYIHTRSRIGVLLKIGFIDGTFDFISQVD